MSGEQCFCLRWNNYQSSVISDLRTLLEQEEFVDVTIACEGRRLKAHRLMLSACSNYFRKLLSENPSDHPIIVLRDVRFWELESIMDFVYNGQVNVMQEQLPGFIRTAEALQIKGLAAVNNNNNSIHPPKMYELKHIHEMLLKQDSSKDSSKYLNPHHGNSNDSLPSDSSMKHIPPLIHPSKRIRYESDRVSIISPSYKEVYMEKSHNLNTNGSNSNVESDGCVDSTRSEKTNNGLADGHRPPILHPNSEKQFYRESEDSKTNERLSPTEKDDTKALSENANSSRSGTPEEERAEIDEDRSSHDGSIASLDGMKDVDWMTGDQSLSVNEAGLPICKICGKVFKHQGSLVAHYQVHQQRTKCPVCKKVLSRHYHMKVHLLTVHKVPDCEIEGLLRSQNIA